MKKKITKSLALLSGLILANYYTAQEAPGVLTQTFHVSGNCGMCKKTIETAASINGVNTVAWNDASKILTVKYNTSKTTPDKILRKIAYAGYDNEKYTAPDKAYQGLHACCQYERETKPGRKPLAPASH